MDETLELALIKEARLELYMREYGEKILHMVYLMTKDRVTAEDITQETFVKVYRNMDSFRGESHIHTWIYRIAVNEAKKHLRKQAIARLFLIKQSQNMRPTRHTHLESNILDSLSQHEFTQFIMLLPNTYRNILVLHYYQDLSIEEISMVLGTTNGAVRKKLHRARKKLKEILKREGFRWN